MKKLIIPPLNLVGASLGLGIAGQGISNINSNIGTQVQEAGQTTAKFIKPSVSITAGGYIVNQLKNLKSLKSNKKFI